MTVAIVILNWNGYDVTRECLKSLLCIQGPSSVVLVVDNGSTDGSVQRLRREFGSVEFLELDNNYGFTGGNNRGIRYCIDSYKPDFMLLLNNDTIVDPSFLNEMLEVFRGNKEVAIVVPKIYFLDKKDRLYYAGGSFNRLVGTVHHSGWKKIDIGTYDEVREVEFASGCAMLVKTSVFMCIGLFDDVFFATSEDVDLSLRVRKNGYKIVYAPKSIVWHREGYSGKSNRGNWFRYYLATRNIVVLQRKHLQPSLYPVFVLLFAVRWMLYLEVKFALLSEWKVCASIWEGFVDGLKQRNRYVPSSCMS